MAQLEFRAATVNTISAVHYFYGRSRSESCVALLSKCQHYNKRKPAE